MRRRGRGGRGQPLAVMGAALAVLASAACGVSHAQGPTCTRADFEAVVGGAAAALRDLTQKNTPGFQGKLRQLKDKRGWSHEQFMTQAAPFVQDEKVAEFDGKSEELLGRIAAMGEEGASAKMPDCALLAQLKGIMQGLVETQQAKWAYMFGKLDDALAR